MKDQNFKIISKKIKDEFILILSNSLLDVIIDNTTKGQIFTLNISYFIETRMHIDEYMIEVPILSFQCISDWKNDDFNINKFFRINNSMFNKFISLADMGCFDSLIPIINEGVEFLNSKYQNPNIDIGFFLTLNSSIRGADDFISRLLEEEILLMELDEGINLSCMQSERRTITIPKGDFITEYSVPHDKMRYFNTPENQGVNDEEDEKYIFVVMSFQADPLLEDTYEAIKRAVSNQKKGLKCERVDEIQEDMVITDKIIDCIKKARIVIVDLTGNRPNVYYELGYARALGKKIILTAKEGEKPHFDVAAQNIIFYRNSSTLEKNLFLRLKHST